MSFANFAGRELELSHSEVDAPRSWIKPNYRSFNGLRGVAVLLVFFCHYLIFWNGEQFARFLWVGVDLFFVLSGFLITGILYDSVNDPHYFRSFYIRRALRIFPLFYGFFLVLLLLTPLLHLHYSGNLFAFALYVGNLIVPFVDLTHRNPTIIWIQHKRDLLEFCNVGHLWSLCVEEQFYIIWPAVVWLVRKRQRLMGVCVTLAVLTLLGRCYLFTHAQPIEVQHNLLLWSTYTRCDSLLVGAWLSLWLRGNNLSRAQLRQTATFLLLMPALVLFVACTMEPPLATTVQVELSPFVSTFGFSLIALAGAGVVLFSLDETNLWSRLLKTRPLSALGTISYGFYFLHNLPMWTLVRIVKWHPGFAYAAPIVAFAVTLPLAMLSFHFYESPFLKLKRRFAPGHRSSPSDRESIEFAHPALATR